MYVSQSAVEAGSAATATSERKTAKYSNLSPAMSSAQWLWTVETLGAPADDALVFLAEVGRMATLSTADLRKTIYLYNL